MRHWLWIPLLGLLLLVGQASAQAPDAAQAFDQGRQRWDAGDYHGALPLFRQALGSSGSPNARIYVARCLRELGRTVEAYEEMSHTVRDARELASQEERYADTRDAAAAELAVLEGKIGKVVVALGGRLQGAQVELNGAPLAQDRVGVPVAVLPGSVTAAAVQSDGTRVEQTANVAPGAMTAITLTATVEAPAAPPPAADPVDQGRDGGGSFGVVRALGIGVAVVGIGGFVTFAVGSVIADDKLATLEATCGPGPCTDPAMSAVIDEGQTAETIAGIGLGVGIAGVLAGTAMIIFGGGDDGDTVVSAGPGGASLKLRF